MSREVIYRDVSPTAAASASAETTDKQGFSDLPLLFREGVEYGSFQTCEHNQTLLNGGYRSFVTEGENFALWSTSQSGADLAFAIPPVLEITFAGLQSSVGVTFSFDIPGNAYALEMNMRWYRNEELLSDMDFYPDRPEYSCINVVNGFNRLIVTFYRMNFRRRFLKLQSIAFGIIRIFGEDELESLTVYEGTDLSGERLVIHSAEFTINTGDPVPFLFQKRQRIDTVYNRSLVSVHYLDHSKRLGSSRYAIETVDAVGVLDTQSEFSGGIYTGMPAEELINQIVAGVFPVEIDVPLRNIAVYGWLPVMKRRDALAQVELVIGALVDTSRSEKIKVRALSSGVGGAIPRGRVFQGANLDFEFPYTGVDVTEHTFTEGEEEKVLLRDTFSGSSYVKFTEPMHSLRVERGTILEAHPNFARVQGSDSGETILRGRTYVDTKRSVRIDNPLILEGIQEKIFTLNDMYLISPHNSAEVAQRVYDYRTKGNTYSADILLQNERIGDSVNIATPFGDTVVGRIDKLSMYLGREKIKAKVVIRSD